MDRSAAARRPVLSAATRFGAAAGWPADHYADPAYYDQCYRARIDDVAFYVARAQRSGGPVLEYGVGTGRVAIPIARHGVPLVGVDRSRAMLGALRARLSDEPITLREGDWRKVRLRARFPLVICPFNGVLHLYTRRDGERFFARVLAHLTPRGSFVCDLNVPSLLDLARDPNKAERGRSFKHPTAGVVRYSERFEYDMATQLLTVRMRFEPKDEPPFEQVLFHRQYFPMEWEQLLWANGLEITERWGDFHGTPFGRDSDQLVCVAKRRRGWK